MDFSQEYKKSIEMQIVQAIIAALENNVIKDADLPPVATFILNNIDNVTTQKELVAFLTALTSQWVFFQNILEIEKGKIKEHEEKETASNVLQLASSGNIEEAITLAKSQTQ